jgi:hypothetical protein
VEPRRKLSGFGLVVKSALAGLLVLLLLAVSALTASPSLHHFLHHDSNESDHSCLVTIFAKGQVGMADVVPVVAFISLVFLCVIDMVQTAPLPFFDYRLSPSRAPPRF